MSVIQWNYNKVRKKGTIMIEIDTLRKMEVVNDKDLIVYAVKRMTHKLLLDSKDVEELADRFGEKDAIMEIIEKLFDKYDDISMRNEHIDGSFSETVFSEVYNLMREEEEENMRSYANDVLGDE